MEKLHLRDFEIVGLRDGFFSLDGGAMFGVVPKVLWEKKFPSDSKNRIRLALNCFIIKTREVNVLVETGLGNKFNQKFSDIYSVEIKPGLVSALREAGIEVEDIDLVVNTHLHFDHCGGNTVENEKGEIVPTFPRARYVIQRGEWEYALDPSERDRASYLDENFLPVKKHGQLELIDGEKEIVPGVRAVPVPGHTAYHQCVKVESQGKVLFFLGDMVPTSAHVSLSYIMSYDLFPLETLKNKKKVYEQAIEEDWILAFDHDPDYFFGKVKKAGQKFEFEPLSSDNRNFR